MVMIIEYSSTCVVPGCRNVPSTLSAVALGKTLAAPDVPDLR